MVDAILGLAVVVLAIVVLGLVVRDRRQAQERAAWRERSEQDAQRAAEHNAKVTAARRRVELALEAIPQGVLILDEAGTTVFSNAVATAFETARHGDALVAAAVEEVVADAIEGHADTRTVELFGPPKRTLVITSTPLLSGGDRVGAVAVIDDVSERRRLDDMRRDFVANISHELKTPVGAISLLAETLVADDDFETTQRLAGRIVSESDRVSRTIDDLLELSRIETEEAPRFETVAVGDVVIDAVARIRPAAEQAGIPIESMVVDPTLAIEGDRRQITSAVSNLLDNAVKYSDAGSPIEVGADLVDGNAGIWVRDHGIGIPTLDVERIFERFYRVDQARSRRTGGTGLGLAIVRHVAHNHDGDVGVESRLGEGSTFTLSLPAAPPLGSDVVRLSSSDNTPEALPAQRDDVRKAG